MRESAVVQTPPREEQMCKKIYYIVLERERGRENDKKKKVWFLAPASNFFFCRSCCSTPLSPSNFLKHIHTLTMCLLAHCLFMFRDGEEEQQKTLFEHSNPISHEKSLSAQEWVCGTLLSFLTEEGERKGIMRYICPVCLTIVCPDFQQEGEKRGNATRKALQEDCAPNFSCSF